MKYRIFENAGGTYTAEARDKMNNLLSIIGTWKTLFEAEMELKEQGLEIENSTTLTLF